MSMKRLLIFFMIIMIDNAYGQSTKDKNPIDFLPQGYSLVQKITGDLNNDAIEDCVLLIQGTDKTKITKNQNNDRVDRNRRGVIILFNKNNKYELAISNYDCFSSENEDGGTYFPPDLVLTIRNGNLYIEYAHGRYGYWQYIFRYQHSDFELIGYFVSKGAPVIESETSINFSTKRKQERIKTIQHESDVYDMFKSKWATIKMDTYLRLSEIPDFDVLDMNKY